MKVPQFQPWVGAEEYSAMGSCFEKNWITEGPQTRLFQRQLLDLTGSGYGVFAPNGTLALYLGLKAIGVGVGDEVIVPDFTFIGSATAIEMVGAKPVFCDVHPGHYQIDLAAAAKLITPETKAIMPVHMYGTVCDMAAVSDFAQCHSLLVIEDAAQAIGAHFKGRHAGTFGTVGIFSFFADKTITTAEGGFVITDDPEIHDKLLHLRNQGRQDRGTFIHPEIGYNFRMTDLQSAMGIVQLGKLPEIIRRKQHILARYRYHLQGLRPVRFFEPPEGAEWIPFRIPVLCERAHDLMAFLTSSEIESRSFFYPLHRQPAFRYLLEDSSYCHSMGDDHFPQAISAYDNGVCLPIFPELSDEQIEYVCARVREFYA
ncbi:MAG: DegT/DnrJ/EryC1/StrS family aminotransferase [Geobacteraceae bacterium]|nr:DegT/DnrJ/EryC1/StrS family aminotransferase [Geobacteraceae bacterium]